MKRITLLIVLIALLAGKLSAQTTLADYTFTASMGTFTPISGGTILPWNSSSDDGYYAVSPIGFNFSYLGINYDYFSASTNGLFVLGNSSMSVASTTTAPSLATLTPRPCMMAIGDDMEMGSGTFTYQTVGTVGNRIFTAEWLNVRWYYTNSTPTISFQIKLYEASGMVQLIYRQESGSLNGSETASIGIGGQSTGAGNFISLTNSSTSPGFSLTTETSTINSKPLTGQTYTFSPPIPLNNDCSVIAINSPQTPISPGVSNVSVSFKNWGKLALSNVVLRYSVDGVLQNPPYSWSGSLASKGIIPSPVTIGSYNFTLGMHTIKAWSQSPNGVADSNHYNDTTIAYVNCCLSKTGAFTIGGAGANFATFADAINSMSSCGISGPVTFIVNPGTYNEKVIVPPINGASATNTVTFRGVDKNTCKITWVGNYGSACTVKLDGADFIRFENLTIENTAPSYYGVDVWFNNNANNNKISNCILLIPSSSSQYYIANIYGGTNDNYTYGYGGDNGYNNIIENNLIVGGCYYGSISWVGPSSGYNTNYNNTFRGNTFEHSYYYSIYLQYVGGSKILNNTVRYPDYTSHIGFYCYYTAGDTIDGNDIRPGYYGIYMYYNNYYAPASWSTLIANNMISGFSNSSTQTGLNIYYYCYRQRVLHNTIWVTGSTYNSYSYAAIYAYYPYNSEFRNNILISSGGTMLFTTYYPTSTVCDNNLYYSMNPTSGAYYFFYNGSYTDFPAFKANINTSYLGTHDVNSFNQLDPGIVSGTDLHLRSGNVGLKGYLTYPGVKYDFDKNNRCALQSYLGADEPYHKKVISDFSSNDTMCLTTPVTFYNSIDPTEPYIATWYKNGSFQTNSLHYTTNFTSPGYYVIKLENQSCSGIDSVKRTVYADNPSIVPITEFEVPKNIVETGENLALYDLSLKCPNRWKWQISPDSVVDPTTSALVPSFVWVASIDTTQSPTIRFNYPGSYNVCLTTWNKIGKGNTKCKTAYINVKLSAVMCGGTILSKMQYGTLYDDGGPSSDHGISKNCSFLISPCTDDVMLIFKQFDLGTNAFVRLYDGGDNRGIPLWNKTAYPKGLTGDISNANFQDTIYATKSGMVFVEFVSGTSTRPGFRMEWEGLGTGKYSAPVASFENYDTGCVVHPFYYTNTSIADTQLTAFQWDYEGNNSIDARTVNGVFKTSFPGLYARFRTYLYAYNCGGSDTFYKEIVLINPRKTPIADFHADVVHPIIEQDAVTLYCDAYRLSCVDGFDWSITPSSFFFVDGTTKYSEHPRIKFTDTGYYNVTLIMYNTNAPSFRDTIYKPKYIKPVKNCTPVVLNLHADVGISHVMLGTIDQKSSIGVSKYTNYANTQSTNIFVGQTYNVTVERTTNFNAMNRKVWIDYNGNGDFNDPGELVAKEDSSTTLSWTGTFIVPMVNVAIGGTIMRVGVSYSNNKNSPCGPNLFGEFEDYRIYVSPDNVAPNITIIGSDTVFVEKGYAYSDKGATAVDNIEGNISSRIATFNPVDIHKEGPYYVTYNVCDNLHNCAITKKRLVIVTPDNTAPIITLYGGDPINTDVNKPVKDSFSAYDLGDGDITSKVVISGYFDNSKLGTYHRTYTVSDSRSLYDTKSRDIIVSDHAAPDISLLGGNPVYLEINKPFIDPGTVYTDNYFPKSKINYVITGFVDTTRVGVYTIKYSVTDALGNGPNVISRTVIVYDSTAPVILSGKIGDVMELEVYNKFIDPGLNVFDNSTVGITIAISGSFYDNFANGIPDKLGNYIIFYQAIDAAGNASAVYGRVVKVVDKTAPKLTLNDQSVVFVQRWQTYTDAGYSVSDNFYNKSTLKIDTISDVDVATVGVYKVSYQATDPSGNKTELITRLVKVKESISGISDPVDNAFNIYPNPSNGRFTISIAEGMGELKGILITNLLGETVRIYNQDNFSGNHFEINLLDVNSGVYFVKIEAGETTVVKRIVISK